MVVIGDDQLGVKTQASIRALPTASNARYLIRMAVIGDDQLGVKTQATIQALLTTSNARGILMAKLV